MRASERRLGPLLALIALSLACATPPSPPQPSLQAQLRDAAVTWRAPEAQAAVAELRALDLELAAQQARARQTLARHGAVTGQLLLGREDDPALAEAIRALAPARCGAADPAPALVLCYRSLVQLQRIPIAAPLLAPLRVSGTALGDARVTEVLHMDPAGEIAALELTRDDRSFTAATPPLGDPGAHSLEIVAETSRGLEIAGLWRVAVAEEPARATAALDDAVDQRDPSDGDAAVAAQRFWSRLNQARVDAGVGPLQWSSALAQAAETRARELARAGQLVHLSPAQRQRLRDDQGRALSWIAENLAQARSVTGALRALDASPAHRRNSMDPGARLGGVGAAWRDRGGEPLLYVTVLLARSYADVDAATLARLVAQRVNAARQAAGLDPLEADVDLGRRASRYAEALSQAGTLRPQERGGQNLSREVLAARRDLVQAVAQVLQVDGPDPVRPDPRLLAPPYNRQGVGVARAAETTPWFVVILVADDGAR